MSAVNELKEICYDVDAIHKAIAVMDWDQQTYMPEGGNDARSHHVSILSRMAHELSTSDRMAKAIESASGEAESGSLDADLVRICKRSYDLNTKIPAALVSEKSRLSGEGHEVWVKARKDNDFGSFAPILSRLVEITREEAKCLGYTDHPYDAVTDQYEEGATKKSWEGMFDGIRQPLVDLVAEIKASPNQVDDSWLYGQWDHAKQRAFGDQLVAAIGFNMTNGRQDTAPHPFCTNFGIRDVRLTTRFKDYLPSSIMGSLHEAGHGMYEQGSPIEWDRLPLAGGVSLGIHESQSRTWENIVGRSLPFWEHFYPQLQASFDGLNGRSLQEWYRCLNKVEPSLIRVEADEVTYNLHIMIRFEIECGLLDGSIAVKDLPEVWNAKYKSYLGIVPPTDSEGCLQDVHWSGGMIGYFPTYSMGNILSAQIWECLAHDLGDVDGLMRAGNFKPILDWLVDKIYSKGSRYRPTDLVKQVTGKSITPEPYLAMISNKYRALYSL